MQKKVSFNTIQSVIFFSILGVLGIGMIVLFLPFLYPIFWAGVIGVLFHPLYSWFFKHSRLPKMSSFLTILIAVATFFLPLTLATVLVINESVNLYSQTSAGSLSNEINETATWLRHTPLAAYAPLVKEQWDTISTEIGKSGTTFLLQNIKTITGNSVRLVLMFCIMLYTLFYLLIDGKSALERLFHLSPLGDRYELLLYERFRSTIRAALKSTLIIGTIQGALGGVLFWVTGMPSPFIWALIMIIFSILPAIGPSIVLIPAAIIQFFMGNMWVAIIFVVGASTIGIVDNIIRPPLIGRDIEMHPVIVLFSTLGGILLFGVSGFVMGPVVAALFLAALDMYDIYYEKELDKN